MIPTSIDGTDITGATIDGTDVTEITVDGDTVFSPQKIVDNFEDAPTGPYGTTDTISTYYTGNTSFYSRSGSNVFEGTKCLNHNATNGTEKIISTSGLPNYPVVGDIFSCHVRTGRSGSDSHVLFGVQDSSNYYEISTENNDFLELKVSTTNGEATLDSVSASHPINTYHRLEVDWKASTSSIVGKLFDTTGNELATVSSNDSTFTNGGIGFENLQFSGASQYDRFVITN
jgi:hypothetical protein